MHTPNIQCVRSKLQRKKHSRRCPTFSNQKQHRLGFSLIYHNKNACKWAFNALRWCLLPVRIKNRPFAQFKRKHPN